MATINLGTSILATVLDQAVIRSEFGNDGFDDVLFGLRIAGVTKTQMEEALSEVKDQAMAKLIITHVFERTQFSSGGDLPYLHER